MLDLLKSTLTRPQTTLVSDALGAAALLVMLMVGLSLPGLA
ncbi:MAG: hypothetical protein AAGD04_11435 [Pseudomonadota bacterium]